MLVVTHPLTLTVNGQGAGRVTSVPFGIDSRPPDPDGPGPLSAPAPDLTETYPKNTVITLTAPADSGSVFTGWSGQGIPVTTGPLTVTLDHARVLTATFSPAPTPDPPPATVDATEVQAVVNNLLFTWFPTPPTSGRELVGYNVYIGLQSGVYGAPTFVGPTVTAFTLQNTPTVEHFFSVTTLTRRIPGPGTVGLESLSSGGLEPAATVPSGTEESGFSPEASGTPDPGLTGWTPFDQQGATNGPSSWQGSGTQISTLNQYSPIDGASSDNLRRATQLYLTDGFPQQRTNYEATVTLRSDAVGAVGVLFRYVDASNYYRFVLDLGVNHLRVIKVVGGNGTTLLDEAPAPGITLQTNTSYVLRLKPIDNQLEFELTVAGGGSVFQVPATRTITDASLAGSKFAFYSAGNPGGHYTLLGPEFIGPPPSDTAPLTVEMVGDGRINSTDGFITLLTPGTMTHTYTKLDDITLIATDDPGFVFSRWTDANSNTLSTDRTLVITDILGQTRVKAVFTGVAQSALTLDVDKNLMPSASALQDGIILVRYLSGVTGPDLTAGALGAGAQRVLPTDIVTFLTAYLPSTGTTTRPPSRSQRHWWGNRYP